MLPAELYRQAQIEVYKFIKKRPLSLQTTWLRRSKEKEAVTAKNAI